MGNIEAKPLTLGAVMWAIRIACSGRRATFGNATEITELLGKKETVRRLKIGLSKLDKEFLEKQKGKTV